MRQKRNTRKAPLYVYVDYKLDLETPFYVGKGYECRTNDFKHRNVVWQRIVAKHGIRREILLGSYDNVFVCDEEIRLIAELNTFIGDNQHAANLTRGGEGSLGWDPSNETRQKMRERKLGKHLSLEHRTNVSVSRSKFFEDIAEREKISVRHLCLWSDPLYRKKMSAVHEGENNSRAKLTEDDVRLIRNEWKTCDASNRKQQKNFVNDTLQNLT